jgi:hypothetical protein
VPKTTNWRALGVADEELALKQNEPSDLIGGNR